MELRFTGTGWAFSPRINDRGGIALSSHEDDIKEAIRIILGTVLGERAMRPEFGCVVNELVFETADASLAGRVEFYVRNALESWEPRINVKTVSTELDEEKIVTRVDYIVRSTNAEDNVVYPYYRKALP